LKPKSYLKLIQLFTMRKFLLSAIIAGMAFGLSAQLSPNSLNTATHGTIYFYQYKPPHYNNTDLFPLIISLHGVGQAGNPNGSELVGVLGDGIPKLLAQGQQLEFTWQGKTEGFVVLAPQTNRSGQSAPNVDSWDPFYVDEMILYGINNLRVDPARIFLTGFSAGGGGVWKYATSPEALANPHKLAGITPASSSDLGTNFCNIGSQQIAVWTFHGGPSDLLIPSPTDHYKAQAVNACIPPPLIPAVDTIVANESHNIYNSVDYDVTNTSHYPNVYQWMLKVNRTLDPNNNQAPIPVIAGGPVINLTAPVKFRNFPVLDGSGSYDPDDIIMDYLWEQASGPYTLLAADASTERLRQFPVVTIPLSPTAIGVNTGTYTFRLRVKDYLTSRVNHTQFSTLAVNVLMPASGHAGPATDAGNDIILGSTTTFVQQSGNAQAMYGGVIDYHQYNWRFLTGPQTPVLQNFQGTGAYTGSDQNVRFTGMTAPGVYTFEFTAGTDLGDVGKDTLAITRLSALPVNYAYFNGQNAGNKNVLSWATTAEVNSDRFDIQRSTDGNSFNTIGTVNSKGGAVLTTYSFDDNNAPAGVAYYRLSQVDKDGRSSLSQVISINSRRTGIYIEKYPNPVHDNLTINVQGSLNGAVQVIIADMQGKAIIAQRWQKDTPALKKIVGVGSLQNGVYQVIVTIGQDRQVSSFVKY
jgi:hypothetical protein